MEHKRTDFNICKVSQAWWCMPIIPAPPEAETSSRPGSATQKNHVPPSTQTKTTRKTKQTPCNIENGRESSIQKSSQLLGYRQLVS
jgi:hypothetical protein